VLGGFLTRKIWDRKNMLGLREELQAEEFVQEIANSRPPFMEDDEPETPEGGDDGEGMPVATLLDMCKANLHLSDRKFRTQVVKRAIFDIRADIGTLSNTPANHLVVGREYRKWAKTRGLRPSHTETFRAYVLLGYFIKSEHDIRADAYNKSAAYFGNTRDKHRWSWLVHFRHSRWAPLMGSTAE
jgi:hypothetical protein